MKMRLYNVCFTAVAVLSVVEAAGATRKFC